MQPRVKTLFYIEKNLSLQKKALDQKHLLWISLNKKHHAKGVDFQIFLHSHFLVLIPRGCFDLNVHFTGRMEKLLLFYTE